MSDREEEEEDDDGVPRLSAHTLAALRELSDEAILEGILSRDGLTAGVPEEDWVRGRRCCTCLRSLLGFGTNSRADLCSG